MTVIRLRLQTLLNTSQPLHFCMRNFFFSDFFRPTVPSFNNLALIFKFRTKRYTKAVTRNNLSQQLKLVIGIQDSRLGLHAVKSTVSQIISLAVPFFCSMRHSSVGGWWQTLDLGQLDTGSDSHDGPFHHN